MVTYWTATFEILFDQAITLSQGLKNKLVKIESLCSSGAVNFVKFIIWYQNAREKFILPDV
jgi:hypothetical protein